MSGPPPLSGASPRWSGLPAAILVLTALGPALTAYWLWDIGMRRGDQTLVACTAFATPLLSTAASCLMLGVLPDVDLWIACVLVIGGAVVRRLSVRPPTVNGNQPTRVLDGSRESRPTSARR